MGPSACPLSLIPSRPPDFHPLTPPRPPSPTGTPVCRPVSARMEKVLPASRGLPSGGFVGVFRVLVLRLYYSLQGEISRRARKAALCLEPKKTHSEQDTAFLARRRSGQAALRPGGLPGQGTGWTAAWHLPPAARPSASERSARGAVPGPSRKQGPERRRRHHVSPTPPTPPREAHAGRPAWLEPDESPGPGRGAHGWSTARAGERSPGEREAELRQLTLTTDLRRRRTPARRQSRELGVAACLRGLLSRPPRTDHLRPGQARGSVPPGGDVCPEPDAGRRGAGLRRQTAAQRRGQDRVRGGKAATVSGAK